MAHLPAVLPPPLNRLWSLGVEHLAGSQSCLESILRHLFLSAPVSPRIWDRFFSTGLLWEVLSREDVLSLITEASPEVFRNVGSFGLVISNTSEPDLCLRPGVSEKLLGASDC